jgi:hypothetical protein
MPYRDLPDDFDKRYRSIWVTPPNDELCDPEKVRQYYKWSLDELELADRLGFDGIGVNEHHQNGYGFMPSPNVMAGALARRTPNNSARSACWATPSPCIHRLAGWPRKWPCSTCLAAGGWSQGSR